MKFKLNTATITWGRVKGWNATSELEKTVKHVKPEEVEALKSAIAAELVKAEANLEKCSAMIPHAKRGTRSGKNIGARFDRAYHKVHSLKDALKALSK